MSLYNSNCSDWETLSDGPTTGAYSYNLVTDVPAYSFDQKSNRLLTALTHKRSQQLQQGCHQSLTASKYHARSGTQSGEDIQRH